MLAYMWFNMSCGDYWCHYRLSSCSVQLFLVLIVVTIGPTSVYNNTYWIVTTVNRMPQRNSQKHGLLLLSPWCLVALLGWRLAVLPSQQYFSIYPNFLLFSPILTSHPGHFTSLPSVSPLWFQSGSSSTFFCFPTFFVNLALLILCIMHVSISFSVCSPATFISMCFLRPLFLYLLVPLLMHRLFAIIQENTIVLTSHPHTHNSNLC